MRRVRNSAFCHVSTTSTRDASTTGFSATKVVPIANESLTRKSRRRPAMTIHKFAHFERHNVNSCFDTVDQRERSLNSASFESNVALPSNNDWTCSVKTKATGKGTLRQ